MNSFFRVALVGFVLQLLQGCATSDAAPSRSLLFSPYKHLPMEVDPAMPVARIRFQGLLTPVVSLADALPSAPLPAVTLAFASGECGAERWGVMDADPVARANMQAFLRKGIAYVISTGGEGAVFTCQSDAGMEAFIARYETAALRGLDFDIEATQTESQIQALVQRVKIAQFRRPHLRFSFTLATFAASDGSAASLNATGLRVLDALRDAGVRDYFINLMVMNYGPAVATNCVVAQGRCDMAASARQAVENLHQKFGLPLDRIEVTAMIGVNDVRENVFRPEDALALARYAKEARLGGLHYWSLDRDKPCEAGAKEVSPVCSSLNHIPEAAYLKAFMQGLR